MSQNITINGNVYTGVKKLRAQKAEDPTELIVFTDTSDADVTADKVLKGSTCYNQNGEKVEGTATMPTFSLADGVLSIY